ncbi:hypothetical protein D3C71_1795490 [compost metagenome]
MKVANIAIADTLVNLTKPQIKPAIEAQHDLTGMLAQCPLRRIRLGDIQIHRLFAQHRLAGFSRGQHQINMGMRRCAYDDGINIRVLNGFNRVR